LFSINVSYIVHYKGNVNYIVHYKGTESLPSQCIVSILCVMAFWCRYVKCSTVHKRHGSRLTIYAHSSDMALKVGLDASFYDIGLERNKGESRGI
jgi:hypothetical protein